jgi:hypothetical protein
MDAVLQLSPTVGVESACDVLGVARASFYRHRPLLGPALSIPFLVPVPRPTPARALSFDERESVRAVLNSERFQDCSPAAIQATLLDEGQYLCSTRTMYRVLEEDGATRERIAFMPAPQADFKSLKQRIPIDHVLARYGVRLRRAGPHTLCGTCPLPTHTSRNSRQSFSVNLSLQVWSCHSASCIAARGGRIGGHVIDLVAIMERCGLREAGLRLQDWFSLRASHPVLVHVPAMEPSVAEPNRPLGFALQRIDTRHPYLTQRGISPATARLLEWECIAAMASLPAVA